MINSRPDSISKKTKGQLNTKNLFNVPENKLSIKLIRLYLQNTNREALIILDDLPGDNYVVNKLIDFIRVRVGNIVVVFNRKLQIINKEEVISSIFHEKQRMGFFDKNFLKKVI